MEFASPSSVQWKAPMAVVTIHNIHVWRMPENLPQILAPFRDQIIDQIYSPHLLWCEMSTSFLRTEQTYTWYHNSNTQHKRWTLDLFCANAGTDSHLPSIRAKCRSSFSLSSQKQDLHVPPGGNVSRGDTTVPGCPGPMHISLEHHGWSSHRKMKGSLQQKSCRV